MRRRKGKIYEISKEVSNDRFFDVQIVQQRLGKSIQSYTKGKTVKLSPERLKDFFGV
ncbi:MAG: hypothetical protein JJU34_03535 [Lunatimonas sp.]|uniref:hypothetical protein n=1 Tax=Lunatimonas sp. TaxID=2060141 RepID=UPI00263ABE45|nr:hypothetical protein [Lunatimonas sp.]MCC5936333.1 hypothetical protein [Lunatimonas sp.]